MTDDLKTKTVTQLIQLCKQNQITGYSKKKKCDLIDMLTKKTEDTQKEATTEQNNSVKECCICYDSIPVSTLFALVPCMLGMGHFTFNMWVGMNPKRLLTRSRCGEWI